MTTSHTHSFHIDNYDKKWAEDKTITMNIAGREWLVIVKRNVFNMRKRKNGGASESDINETNVTSISNAVAVSAPLGGESAIIQQHGECVTGGNSHPSVDNYLSFHIVNNGIDAVLTNISLIIYNSAYEERNEYLNSYALLEVDSNCAFGCSHFMPLTVLIDPSAGFLDSNRSLKIGVTVELFTEEQPRFSLSQALNYLKNINIMVVEDSHFQRKLMCKSLNAANTWLVSSVASPLEILGLLSDSGEGTRDLQKIDVFIIDYNLDVTGVSGADLTLKLRENNVNSVIIGCSTSIAKYASKFIAAGANSAWPKPFPCAAEMVEYLYSALMFRKTTVMDGSTGDSGPFAFAILNGTKSSKKNARKSTIVNPGFNNADCILVAKLGQRIPAHRLTLAACSKLFADIFLDVDKEVTDELEEIVFDDDTHILQEVVRFSYTASITESAMKSYSDALLQFAIKYQFNSMVSILTVASP